MDITTEDILNSINKNKLPMQNLSMPGASHVMGLAKNISQAIPGYANDIFQRMKRAVTQGPYSSPTGEYDPSIGTLPLEVMTPGYGRAAGLAAFGGRKGPQYVSAFTPQMQSTIKNLVEKYKDVSQPGKLIARDFRGIHPDYAGSDGNLQKTISKIKTWGGANIETGAKSTKDIELGAFGGQGRLNTPSYGESINRLQEQTPVTLDWVKQWAKEADVPIKSITGEGSTKYVKLEGQKRVGDKDVTVRIPQDEERHIGTSTRTTEIGNMFDTGIGLTRPDKGTSIRPGRWSESTLINQSGMPYANPEALDAALKWRLSKAPGGKNWLISEDMAPRIPERPNSFIGPELPPNAPPGSNQLKLLSSGFTPYDILKILGNQNGNQ